MRVGPDPHATLGQRLDLVRRSPSPGGDDAHEGAVHALDLAIEGATLALSEGKQRVEQARVGAPLEHLRGDAERASRGSITMRAATTPMEPVIVVGCATMAWAATDT